jgi:hypothetical protein
MHPLGKHLSPASSSELEPPVAADQIADVPLHRLKAHGATALALQVVDDSSQSLEVGGAAPVRAMVESLLVWACVSSGRHGPHWLSREE